MADLPDFDPYSVLGVDRGADSNSIKKAYKKLALIKHPDKCGTDEALRKQRTDEFQRLNEAYAILNDDEKRSRHDALVRLEALRREKASFASRAPAPPGRGFTRSHTFATGTAYTSFGATNVEDRAPRFHDNEPIYSRGYGGDDYYSRTSKSARIERERARAEREASEREADERRRRRREELRRDEERRADEKAAAKRAEIKREQEREALRLMQKAREEDERRRLEERERAKKAQQEESKREKYSNWEEEHQSYTGAQPEPRPGVQRRTSTRDVPRPYMARRSRQSPPKDEEAKQRKDERAHAALRKAEDERKLRERDQRYEAQQQRYQTERLQQKLERERQKAAEKDKEEVLERLRQEQALRDRENIDRMARVQQDRYTEREAERLSKRSGGYPNLRGLREEVARPPTLQHHNSSPPFSSGESIDQTLPRRETEPPRSSAFVPPGLNRSSTEPTLPNSAARRSTRQPGLSGLGQSANLGESGYSSSGTAASGSDKHAKSKGQKTRTYHYGLDTEDDVVVEGARRSRRTHDEPSKPSKGATRWANIAPRSTSKTRPGTSSGAVRPPPHSHSYSSSDRTSRREERNRARDYYNDRGDYYGSRNPPYAESPSYKPTYSSYGAPEYSGRPSTSSRSNDYFRPPTSHRAVPTAAS